MTTWRSWFCVFRWNGFLFSSRVPYSATFLYHLSVSRALCSCFRACLYEVFPQFRSKTRLWMKKNAIKGWPRKTTQMQIGRKHSSTTRASRLPRTQIIFIFHMPCCVDDILCWKIDSRLSELLILNKTCDCADGWESWRVDIGWLMMVECWNEVKGNCRIWNFLYVRHAVLFTCGHNCLVQEHGFLHSAWSMPISICPVQRSVSEVSNALSILGVKVKIRNGKLADITWSSSALTAVDSDE